MATLAEWFFYLLIFFLPWQTVLIIRKGAIGIPGTFYEGIWQYGTIGMYLWDFIAVSCIITFFLGYIRSKKNVRASLSAEKKFFSVIALVVVTALTIVWSQEKNVAIYYTFRLLEGVFLFFTIRSMKIDWRKVAFVLVGAGALQALFGITQFFTQEISANTLLGLAYHSAEQLGDAVVQTADARWLRAYGSFPHPNMLGYFLGIAFMCCTYLIAQAQKKIELYVFSFLSALLLSGIFFSFSRESWIGVALAFSFPFLIWRKEKQEAIKALSAQKIFSQASLLFTISFVMIAALSVINYEPLSARLGIGGAQRLEQKSINERLSLLRQGWEVVKQSPMGVGIGNYTYSLFKQDVAQGIKKTWHAYQPIHSQYLLVAAELGVIGFIIFILFLASLAFSMLNKGYVSDVFLLKIRIMLLTLSVGMFDHFFWTVPAGILMWWISMGCASQKLAQKLARG